MRHHCRRLALHQCFRKILFFFTFFFKSILFYFTSLHALHYSLLLCPQLNESPFSQSFKWLFSNSHCVYLLCIRSLQNLNTAPPPLNKFLHLCSHQTNHKDCRRLNVARSFAQTAFSFKDIKEWNKLSESLKLSSDFSRIKEVLLVSVLIIFIVIMAFSDGLLLKL